MPDAPADVWVAAAEALDRLGLAQGREGDVQLRRALVGEGPLVLFHADTGELREGASTLLRVEPGSPPHGLLLAALSAPHLDRRGCFERAWPGNRYNGPASDNTFRVALNRLRKQLPPGFAVEATPNGGLSATAPGPVWLALPAEAEASAASGPPPWRAALVAQAAAALRGPAGTVVFTGAGGVGKTTLVHEVAATLGVPFLVVACADRRSEGALLDAVGAALDVPGTADCTPREVGAALRRRFGGEGLLVLEDVEPAAEGAVELVRSAAPALRLIVTRRSGSPLPWRELVVRPLELPEARELFMRAAADAGARIGDVRPEELAIILEGCAGLPLALHLAATRLAAVGGALLARLLAEDLTALDDRAGGRLHRLLADTVGDLDPDELALATALAAFSRAAEVATVAEVAERPEAGLLRALGGLDRRGLTDRTNTAEGRVALRRPFRNTLRGLAPERVEAARARMCRALSRASERTLGPRNRADTAEQIAWLRAERENLTEALLCSVTEAPDVSARLAATLFRAAVTAGGVPRIGDLLDRAREGVARLPPDPASLAMLLHAQAHTARLRGDLAGALARAREMVGVATEPASRASALGLVAQTTLELGDTAAAMEAYDLAESAAVAAGLPDLAARAREGRGLVQMKAGEAAAAEQTFREVAERFAALGDTRSLARTSCNRAEVAFLLGDLRLAARRANEAIAAARTLGERLVEPESQATLARAGLRLGTPGWEQARARALELAQEMGNTELRARLLSPAWMGLG